VKLVDNMWITRILKYKFISIYSGVLLTLAVFFIGGISPVRAALVDDLRLDAAQTADWFSGEMASVMAFHAASMPHLPGDVLKVLGVEFGVSGGVSFSEIDVDAFRQLGFRSLDNRGGEIDLPSDLPIPGYAFHAKIGLPRKYDIGFKYGSLDFDHDEGNATFELSNAIYGIAIRKRFLGGGAAGYILPDVALSLGHDAASGDISRKEPYNAPLLNGETLAGETVWTSDWDVGAVTGRALFSQKILIVTPFLGVGVTQLTGSADSLVRVSGTASASGAILAESLGSENADETLFHVMGGAELSLLPFVRLNAGALWANGHWSASGGLRVQFR